MEAAEPEVRWASQGQRGSRAWGCALCSESQVQTPEALVLPPPRSPRTMGLPCGLKVPLRLLLARLARSLRLVALKHPTKGSKVRLLDLLHADRHPGPQGPWWPRPGEREAPFPGVVGCRQMRLRVQRSPLSL